MRYITSFTVWAFLLVGLLGLSGCGETIPQTQITTYAPPASGAPLYQKGDQGYLQFRSDADINGKGLHFPNLSASGGWRLDTHLLVMGRFQWVPGQGTGYYPAIHGTAGMLALGFSTYQEALPQRFLFDLYFGFERGTRYSQETYRYDNKQTEIDYRWRTRRFFLQGVLSYQYSKSFTLFLISDISTMSVGNFEVTHQKPSNKLPKGLPQNGRNYAPLELTGGFEVGKGPLRLRFCGSFTGDLGDLDLYGRSYLLLPKERPTNTIYLSMGLNYYFPQSKE